MVASIVSVFILYVISFKSIIYTSILLVSLFGVWNFRYELGIQRRLLKAGLVLGIVHKRNHRCSVGYIFQPTWRNLSDNRGYPTHQSKYKQLGAFPSILLKQSPFPILKAKTAVGQITPVTIKLNCSGSPTPLQVVQEPDPSDAKTVVAALKEVVEKKSRRAEKIKWDSTGVAIAQSGRILKWRVGSRYTCKMPTTWSSPTLEWAPKRQRCDSSSSKHKNNAISSSYSSMNRNSKQLTEIFPTSKTQVKAAPLSKDRLCQTESPVMIGRSDDLETPIPNQVTTTISGETPSIVKKPPFPALKEGFSHRQNISLYADIGKSSSFVYKMPEHLATVEEYQHDQKIRERHLNHLLIGSRKPT